MSEYKIGIILVDVFNPFIKIDIERCRCKIVDVRTQGSTSVCVRIRKWPETIDPDNGNETNPVESNQWMPIDRDMNARFKFESEVDLTQLKVYEQLSKQKCAMHKKPLKYNWNSKTVEGFKTK